MTDNKLTFTECELAIDDNAILLYKRNPNNEAKNNV